MSKKTSVYWALALTVLMLASVVAGCGGDKKPAPAAATDIKIGANWELTGGQATFGQSSVNGAKLALKEVNATGGVLGKKITLVVADNKSEPS